MGFFFTYHINNFNLTSQECYIENHYKNKKCTIHLIYQQQFFFHLRYKKDSLMSPQLHFKIFIIKTIKIICFKNQMLEE